VIDLGTGAQRIAIGDRADRRDHELLDVDVGVGVRTTVEDVHHRHRQQVRVRATDVAEERQPARLRPGLGRRERHPEDRVGAEPALVRCAVEVNEHLVDQALLGRVVANQLRHDVVLDRDDRIENAFAAIPVAAVTFLYRFECTRRRATGHGRTRDGAVVEHHLDLDGRVAAGVENLPGCNCLDR